MKIIILLLLSFGVFAYPISNDRMEKIDFITPLNQTEVQVSDDFVVTGQTTLDTALTGVGVLNSGVVSVDANVSLTELGYLDGVTSAIQTQIDSKQASLTGTDGDLYYWNSGLSNLGVGTEDQVLQVSSLGFPEWADPPVSTTLDTKGQLQGYSTQNANVGPCTDDQILVYDAAEETGWKCSALPSSSPTTTEGDIIYNDGGGAASDARLAVGSEGQFLQVSSGIPSWQDIQSGEFSYIENGNAEIDASGWTVYANTTAGELPDDFGGTPSGNLTFTRDTTVVADELPLFGDASFKLSKDAANRQGEGVYYEFTAENGSLTKIYRLLGMLDSSSTNYDTGDIKTVLVSSSDDFASDFNIIHEQGDDDLAAGAKDLLKSFQLDASDTKYRICFHVATDDDTAYDVYLDEAKFSKQVVSTGSSTGDFKDYTPSNTQGLGTVTNNNLQYKKDGDTLIVRGDLTTGTVTASEAQIELPHSYTIDSEKVGSTQHCGVYFRGTSSTSNGGSLLITGGDTFFNFSGATVFDSSALNALSPANGSGSLGSSEKVSIRCEIPIQGWSSNTQMSEDFGNRNIVVEGRGNSGAPSSGSVTADVTDIWFDETRDTAAAWDGDSFTAPESGEFPFSGLVLLDSSTSLNINVYINGSSTGIRVGEVRSASSGLFQGKVRLEKGDVFSLRFNSGATLSNNTVHRIHISRDNSNERIAQTERVLMKASTDAGLDISSEATVVFEDLEHDDTGDYDTSTGDYEVSTNGAYAVNIKLRVQEAFSAGDRLIVRLKVDGNTVEDDVIEAETSATLDMFGRINTVLPDMVKGQVITVTAQAAGGDNLFANGDSNTLSIYRIK